MATKSGPPIGPFPEGVESDEQKEEYDKLRRRVLWKMPYGLYVVGARDGERRNGMTLNWASQVSFEPKLVGISVEKEAFTHELIEAGKVFSLNLLPQEERAAVRKFVKPVEVDARRQDAQRLRLRRCAPPSTTSGPTCKRWSSSRPSPRPLFAAKSPASKRPPTGSTPPPK